VRDDGVSLTSLPAGLSAEGMAGRDIKNICRSCEIILCVIRDSFYTGHSQGYLKILLKRALLTTLIIFNDRHLSFQVSV
jgi:hypothetical protein